MEWKRQNFEQESRGYQKLLELKFPVGQKITIKGYEFIISRKYSREKYKLKILENTKVDFVGKEFSFGGKSYKIIKKTGGKEWMIKQKK